MPSSGQRDGIESGAACFLRWYDPDQVQRVCGCCHTLSASRSPEAVLSLGRIIHTEVAPPSAQSRQAAHGGDRPGEEGDDPLQFPRKPGILGTWARRPEIGWRASRSRATAAGASLRRLASVPTLRAPDGHRRAQLRPRVDAELVVRSRTLSTVLGGEKRLSRNLRFVNPEAAISAARRSVSNCSTTPPRSSAACGPPAGVGPDRRYRVAAAISRSGTASEELTCRSAVRT